LSGVARGQPKLAFTITAGPRERPLRKIAISLPDLLRVVAHGSAALRAGVVVEVRNRRVQFSARLHGRELTITLRTPSHSIRIAIGHTLIRVSNAVAQKVRKHRLKSAVLVLVATEVGGKQTRLKVVVSAR
jgi:hypothetical protein